MKKTKIVTTLDNTIDEKIITDMILEGVDVFRINLGNINHDICDDIILKIRNVEKELKKIIGIMIDIPGPCIKLDKLKENEVVLEKDKEIRFYDYHVVCNNTQLSTNCSNLSNLIELNEEFYLNNGNIKLEVIDMNKDNFICKVIDGGIIQSNQAVHIKDGNYKLPFISKIDQDNILYAIKKDVDFLALSNVRDEQDILEVIDLLIENGNEHLGLLAKIENERAFENLDEILKICDGVIVSRGYLGTNIPLEKLPFYQRKILETAKLHEKLGLVATDLLSTVNENSNPTRSEVADIYNAVFDKCDALVLEDIIKNDPIDCIGLIEKVIGEAENDFNYKENLDQTFELVTRDITSTIAYSVVDADLILDANAILANTISGYTAKKISFFHPKSLILGLSPNLDTLKSLTLHYGIYPILVKEFKDTDSILKEGVKKYKEVINYEEGDVLIITGGLPLDNKCTDFLKIEKITE